MNRQKKTSRLRSIERLEPRRVLDSTVVFNEVMYHPSDEGEHLEFIEFHNQMAVDMDISDWQITDGVQFKFPKGTILAGGGFLVVARDPEALKAEADIEAFGPYLGRLSNRGERISLQDQSGRRMDVLSYSDRDAWPDAADGAGASLAKIDENRSSERSENWSHSIVVGGTPGRANFDRVDHRRFPMRVSELPAANDDNPFVELINLGASDIDLSQYVIAVGDKEFEIPSGVSISANRGLATFFQVPVLTDGDVVAVYDATRTNVLDAARVRDRSVGLVDDQWVFTSVTTPNDENVVVVQEDVVINEIMYNFRPSVAVPAVPPTLDEADLIEFAHVWRYNDQDVDLGIGWQAESHAVGVDGWKEGPGLLAFETSPLPGPGQQTELEDPRDRRTITVYFDTEFELSEEQLAAFDVFRFRHLIDDGAVFYVNGEEVHRFNLPDGPIDAETRAASSIRNAEISEPVEIPKILFVEGTNRISVEVHQRSPTSNDVVFGMRLTGGTIVAPGVPAKPYQENPEEWIELYNRSTTTVEMGSWQLTDAIAFEFPQEFTLPPQSYALVARDAEALGQKYPELKPIIVGEYRGTLSNKHDRIVLRDDHQNIADVVEYYEDGQWPTAADGRGSSLELLDPFADNARGMAWLASDEAPSGFWKNYSYRGIVKPSPVGQDNQWQEFVMGLLSDGTVLLDDIQVIRDPDGDAVDVLQNGSFENDVIGDHPAKWRLIGNHRHSEIVSDPDDAANKVLKLVATGATEHMHNHAETTLFENGRIHRISNGTEYEIRYRARWMSGSNQLNTRLYFNRLPRTTPISRPSHHGTPGRENSHGLLDIGPTFEGLQHAPAVPQSNEPVKVSVQADDPRGVRDVTLWYRADRQEWSAVPMKISDGRFEAEIPAFSAGTIVQFYVEGNDIAGNRSFFPRKGPDSRALYKVDSGEASTTGLHNLRMVMTPDDALLLHDTVEVMSNDPIGLTLIYDESTIFYDANVRLSGSQRARPFQPRLSFKVGFNSDQLFRGVHNGITLDRSESTGYGQREHIYHQGMSRAGGGLPSEYNDLFHIITPKRAHTGGAEAQLARYSDIFLDEQYVNGSSGQVFEYEAIYYPTTTDDRSPEGRKRPQPDSVLGTPIRYLGDSKEDFRWNFLNKNNRLQDDYSRLMEFTRVYEKSGAAFDDNIADVIDVDQWLRAFAFSIITGHGDNYGGDGAQHNMQMYIRPDDERVLFFPHDLDAFFSATRAIIAGGDHRKLIRPPQNAHMYYGHLYDMLTTVFNRGYMQHWTDLYKRLLPDQQFERHLEDLDRRTQFLLRQIERVAEMTDFSAQTESSSVDTNYVTVTGKGWFNVREIRLSGSPLALPVEWTDVIDWKIDVPLSQGKNELVFEAFDFQGNHIGSETVTVETTASNPVRDSLVLTEINYHPHSPTSEELELNSNLQSDDFEFLEFTNVGQIPLNLSGVSISSAVEFVFPVTVIEPGESIVVVKDEAAFAIRYHEVAEVVGSFQSGQLNNRSERIIVSDVAGEELMRVEYRDSDPWPRSADGVGATLHRRPETNFTLADRSQAWQASQFLGGSPGRWSGELEDAPVVINEVLANSKSDTVDAIELHNRTGQAIDISGWYLSDNRDELFKFRVPDGTQIPADGFVVFTEADFNPTPNAPGRQHFAINSGGDDLWLIESHEETVTRIVDTATFDATEEGQIIGRPPEMDRFAPLRRSTFGSANSEPIVPVIVVSEVNFEPDPPSSKAMEIAPEIGVADLEFVEVSNRSDASVALEGWKIGGGIDFSFESVIQPNGSIVVVSFDPMEEPTLADAFREHYQVAGNRDIRLVGPYRGQLHDTSELIRLLRPAPEMPNAFVLAEDFVFDTVAPWPTDAGGTGKSIMRRELNLYSGSAGSWISMKPSPGVATQPGDVNADGAVDIQDMEAVCGALHSGPKSFDLNQDGTFDVEDVLFMVHVVFESHLGDSNLDGVFNSKDLIQVFDAAKYEDGVPGNATWSEGDWNCDGDFSTRDFVSAFRDGGYVQAVGVHQAASVSLFGRTIESALQRKTGEPSFDKKLAHSMPVTKSASVRIEHHSAVDTLFVSELWEDDDADPLAQLTDSERSDLDRDGDAFGAIR